MMFRLLFILTVMLSTAAEATPSQLQFDGALEEVKAEEMVFDAFWQDRSHPTLVARVFDNGSRWNGYAGYLCMLLSEHGISGGVVRVIDVVSEEQEELGQSMCKRSKTR